MANIQYTTEEQIAEMREEIRLAREKASNKRLTHSIGYKKATRWIKRIVSIILTLVILFLAFVLIGIFIAKGKGETPSIFGYRLYIVETGSMLPTFNVGSIIISKTPKDPATLSEGDIVTFSVGSGNIVTHRIIEVVYDDTGFIGYRTKGDNPINSPDVDLLKPDQIIAVYVLKVPFT
ncbi:MAG: signal peptidase I [Clostridiales bacterium]|nr:signal peptidase I [Clostridiales bacterium]